MINNEQTDRCKTTYTCVNCNCGPDCRCGKYSERRASLGAAILGLTLSASGENATDESRGIASTAGLAAVCEWEPSV